MLRDLVTRWLREAPVDEVMRTVERLCVHDRYQASLGIEAAAGIVAELAEASGLREVQIHRFPADGTPRWWSFRAPVSWTPTLARLEAHTGEGCVLSLDHARTPNTIATYSAPTPRGGLVARLVDIQGEAGPTPLHGAVAIVGRAELARSDLQRELLERGALGFVTGAPSRVDPQGVEHPGRIELDPDSRLFAFSLTARDAELARRWALDRAEVRVEIAVDRSASMPVVTAVSPGEVPEEGLWLTAHLCHPRPGANDNASGVAALIGLGAALRRIPGRASRGGGRRSIRFLWGPEFVGVAALLRARLDAFGTSSLPRAVLNLDMVGEDQALCGCPLLIERPPDHLPSRMRPFADLVAAEVFSQTAASPGRWRSVPFMGFSDHALFAAPDLARPAVQICHAPDRFNHSAADSLDKVSSVEVRRSIAIAGALAQVVSDDGALPESETESLLRRWCDDARIASRGPAPPGLGEEWSRRRARHMEWYCGAILDERSGPAAAPPAHDIRDTDVLAPRFQGPFNARAMLSALPHGTRSAVSAAIFADKRALGLLLNFAVRCRGDAGRGEIVEATSLALEQPIDSGTSRLLFDALVESGWVGEAPREHLDGARSAHAPQVENGTATSSSVREPCSKR